MIHNSRALRRHHKIRLSNKRRSYMLLNNFVNGNTKSFIAKVCKTPSICSCDSCCNPRRNEWNKDKSKLTLQERKSGLKDVYEIYDG